MKKPVPVLAPPPGARVRQGHANKATPGEEAVPHVPGVKARDRWVARSLREITEDETGVKPSFDLCLSLACRYNKPSVSTEVLACEIFDAHEEELVVSGKPK